MVIFSSLGHTAIRVTHGGGSILVFPEDSTKPKEDELVIKSSPVEEPTNLEISWPGEYDVKGVAIRGIGHDEGKIVSYVLDIEGARCAFLCSPLRDWTDHEIELLGDVDVLFIPTDDPKILQKLIDEIDPRVLVPVDTGGKEKHNESLKICGAIGVEPIKEYKIKGSLPAEGREVVILEA